MRFSTLIFRNLMRRGVRSALTILGLAVGVAAVVSLLGIAWGFEESFLTIYQTKSIDLVVVKAGAGYQLSSNLEESMESKIAGVPGVDGVVGSLTDVVSFEEANLVSVLVNGWKPGSLLFRGIRVTKGRALAPDDRGVALLGRVLALNLGKTVGDRIEVAGEAFQVEGVYESDSLFENGGVIVPLPDLQKLMGREGYVSGFVVSSAGKGEPEIRALARRIEATVSGVAAVPARDFVRGETQISLIRAMAWATSVIATILGSVGVLNTMLMTVFERTREIGILRALGWRRSRVLRLVVGEAAILGLIGAFLGTCLGYLGVVALSRTPMGSIFIRASLPASVLAVGVLLGLGLSLAGGLYPGLRAAALDPTEALRHE